MKQLIKCFIIISYLVVSIKCFAIPLDNDTLHLEINEKGSFDIFGREGDRLVQTTFNNNGYTTFLQIGDKFNTLNFTNGTHIQLDGIALDFEPEFVGDNYFKIKYKVTNISDENKVISLGFDADIQINRNDKAPVDRLPGDRGFIMYSGDKRFTLMCKNIPNIESVDTYWFGHFGQRQNNRYTQVKIDKLSGEDSGMALSWQNRTLKPGETKVFSTLIGIGSVASVDILTEYSRIGDNTKLPVSIIAITDASNALKVFDANTRRVYYNSNVKEKVELPLDREGDYKIQAEIISNGRVIATSEPIHVNKVNILNRAINALNLKNGLNKFIIINEKERYFEDNKINKNMVDKIKDTSTGTYLIIGEISPVLEPLLEW